MPTRWDVWGAGFRKTKLTDAPGKFCDRLGGWRAGFEGVFLPAVLG